MISPQPIPLLRGLWPAGLLPTSSQPGPWDPSRWGLSQWGFPDWGLPHLGVPDLLGVALLFLVQAAFAVRVLLRHHQLQSSSLAWILLIFGLPGLGILLYLFVGEVRLGRSTARSYAEIDGRLRERLEQIRAGRAPKLEEVPERFRPLAELGRKVGGMSARGGHRLKLRSDSSRVMDSLAEDIERARDHVHLLTYIYLDDGSGRRVAEALVEAAGRGVACRLLVDAVGSKQFLRSDLPGYLEEAGVEVEAALPVSFWRRGLARIDVRNHRKLAVVDGRVGWTGSQNVADPEFTLKPDYAPWVDVMVRMEGPVVRDLQVLFLEDWYLATGEELDRLLEIEPPRHDPGVAAQLLGTGPHTWNEALEQLVQAALHSAREEVLLTTPYYVPDEGTASALRTAASRGVHTRLVVPERNDSPLVALASRSYYSELLEPEAEIYEYPGGILHAKTLTVDRALALVMTANMDRRSFEINFEVSLLVFDAGFARQLAEVQEGYVEESRRVEPKAWRERPWYRRAAENAAGMLSPIL